MATYGATGLREVKARKAYTCENCEGTIDRGEIYFNFHSDIVRGNWQGRKHLDCGPAWWQGDPTHLLSSVAALPGLNPPDDAVQPTLSNLPIHIRSIGNAGEIRFDLSPHYAQRLLHTPNLGLRQEALDQIGRAQALFAECLMAASGNQQIGLKVSHLLQQMAQTARIDPFR